MTTVIRNGTIVTADLTYKADVLIDGGKITAIGPKLKGDRTLDATGCYVMPGGDRPPHPLGDALHGHLFQRRFRIRHPRGAVAAAPRWSSISCCRGRARACSTPPRCGTTSRARANCDYSYHMAITWWGEKVWDDMKTVTERGINTFKHFMAYKGALMVNDDEMFASFTRCAELGAIPFVHAENGDVVAELQRKLLAEGNTGPEAHAYSRPPAVEGEATNRAIMIADMAGVPVYIVHTSCEEAHEAIRRARMRGQRVWGEPLIQHLTLDEGEYVNKDWDHAARRVMSPPFRSKHHQDSLWAGLQSGSLSVVATDHCAFTTAQKRFGVGDFTKIPNGTGGLEDRMPMLWTHGVETGRITMNEFVAVTSTNIAKILNCYPKKGAVLVGADADLVVWDPKKTKTISAKTQQSRH